MSGKKTPQCKLLTSSITTNLLLIKFTQITVNIVLSVGGKKTRTGAKNAKVEKKKGKSKICRAPFTDQIYMS